MRRRGRPTGDLRWVGDLNVEGALARACLTFWANPQAKGGLTTKKIQAVVGIAAVVVEFIVALYFQVRRNKRYLKKGRSRVGR